jgi:tRNA-splicing ligase RtcB
MSNFEVMQGRDGKGIVKSWTKNVPFESEAREQLKNIASLPFIHSHVAAMPDVHAGIGATVGSVIATKGAIIPAAVGVDIGCGMNAVRLSLKATDLPDNLKNVRGEIEKMIPVGNADHTPSSLGSKHHQNTTKILNNTHAWLEPGYKALVEKHPDIAKMGRELDRRVYRQIGTLGGGNHFIELCIDENQDVWVMLHSGSRNPGNCIGRYFIELARKDMERHFISLPDKDLAYLVEGTEHYDDYVMGVHWAQDYAMRNRQVMLQLVLAALERKLPEFEITQEAINCHHNYVAMENHFGANVHVTRKGAVRARAGDLGIIPGSMGAKSYIVRGKGNPDSFHSCSHGAGRQYSRSKAKDLFTLEDHYKATEGVECRKDLSVLDETPGAYKDIDAVMEAQKDLVEVVHTLKQVLCVKG